MPHPTKPKPPALELRQAFDLDRHGSGVSQLYRLDGQWVLLLMQAAGQFQSALASDREDLDAHDQSLYCLTVQTLGGQVLWQDGRPWDHDEPFTSHGGSRMFTVADVDADGRDEIVVVHGKTLAILDAATGRTKRSAALPMDNMVNVFTAQLGPREAGRHIIVKVNDKAHAPWDYANPTMVFAPDLSVAAEPFAVRGAGHNLVAADVDGDGYDELFMGFSMFDHDLKEMWRLDLGEGYDYIADHADDIDLVEVDGRSEIRYAGSEDLFAADLNGNVIWRAPAGHSQSSIALPWPGGDRILMSEKNLGISGYDASGNRLWNRTDLNGYATAAARLSHDAPQHWAIFRPQFKPFGNVPFTSDPQRTRELWPVLMDGDGHTHDALPWDDSCTQPAMHIRARRSYDCGLLFRTHVRDLDGDGLDELVVHDRRRAWVFGVA